MSELKLTDAQWASFAAEFCKGFTKEQAEVCRTFCEVRGLLPGKHVIFNLRSSSDWDEAVGAKVKTTKIIFMTTIDASRSGRNCTMVRLQSSTSISTKMGLRRLYPRFPSPNCH